jgi:N-hydroxyarylamine O-acetyltransferase
VCADVSGHNKMNKQAYLNRISYQGKLEPSLEVLCSLHQHHVFNVPFENLDIHYAKEIILEEAAIYKKVVKNYRGGFCYELNLLFHWLLTQMGFKSKIIAARVVDSQAELGPAFDHMCILVDQQQPWLIDVGYGDLFLRPIAVKEDEIQTDDRHFFKIEKYSASEYVLLMSPNQVEFTPKYVFSTESQPVANFTRLCHYKQTNPDSYFVKNKVCTKPTLDGRITLFNQKLIHKIGEHQSEYLIEEERQLRKILKSKFNVMIK